MNIIVAMMIALLFGLLAHPARGQGLPVGVTYKDGVYIVERSVLRRYKNKERVAYRALAKQFEIKYRIVRNKK